MPSTGCPGSISTSWFLWTADSNGTAVLDTCGQTTVDTKAAIYPDTGCPSDGDALACNDDVCGQQTAVAWPVISGTDYLIQFGCYPGAAAGTGTFQIAIDPVGGTLASYFAGTAGNPPTAPPPTGSGWTEDSFGGTVNTTDVSPDGGTGLNAWQIDDSGSGANDKLHYEALFGPEAVAIGRSTGWKLTAEMRFVGATDYTVFFEYSTGQSTVHDRYHVWFREAGGNDLTIKVLGPGGVEYTLTGARDGNYHTFEMRKPAGQEFIDAEFVYDDVVIGPVTPATGTAANANGGVRWGAGHHTNQGTANWNSVRFELGEPITGVPFCFGDGSGTQCPCGNNGGAGEGCANSTGSGAILAAEGSNSVGADDLSFSGSGMLPNQPGLLFVGNNAVNNGNGNTFGDGLRCAGQGVVRLGVRFPDGGGNATWGPGLAGTGGWTAGDQRYFQIW